MEKAPTPVAPPLARRTPYDLRVLTSALFRDDGLLDAIAAGAERISRTRHHDHPAVKKVQHGLLIWDAGCLPLHGPDGTYADETAAAVMRFKIEVLEVPEISVIDDVGPKTVLRLDEMAAEHERTSGFGPVHARTRDRVQTILADSSSPTVAALGAELAHHGIMLTPIQVASVMARLLDA